MPKLFLCLFLVLFSKGMWHFLGEDASHRGLCHAARGLVGESSDFPSLHQPWKSFKPLWALYPSCSHQWLLRRVLSVTLATTRVNQLLVLKHLNPTFLLQRTDLLNWDAAKDWFQCSSKGHVKTEGVLWATLGCEKVRVVAHVDQPSPDIAVYASSHLLVPLVGTEDDLSPWWSVFGWTDLLLAWGECSGMRNALMQPCLGSAPSFAALLELGIKLPEVWEGAAWLPGIGQW